MAKQNKQNRRDFLEKTVQGAIAIGISSIPLVNTSCSKELKVKTVHGACCLDCPDSCSWTVKVENNKIVDFAASKSNPFTAGKLCDKMANYPQDVTFNPERILKPLKRIGEKGKGEFEEITWEKAISEISEKLKGIIAKDGGEGIMPFSYGGNEGNVQNNAGNRFFAHIGATKLDRTICGDAAVAGIMATNGQTTGVLPEDIIHSRFIILWGTNTVNSNQHLWPFVEEARADGAKIIVIDPFKSQTALLADQHIQPLPGTDTALALGMIHVILNENLQDKDYIEKYTNGIAELTQHVSSFTPKHVAQLCGLEEAEIIELARSYSAGKPSLIRVLIGLEHHANGANAFRAIAILPSLIGSWKQKGGGMMNMTYELFGDALNYQSVEIPESLSAKNTRSVNMVQLGKALTDNTHQIPINAIIIYNSNPAVTMPNQNLVVKGLERTDLLTVVLEHFVTDTCRYADYIFPATTSLENWDLLSSYGTPYLNINEPAIEPLGESKPNTEFFRLLSKKMGYTESYLYLSDLEIVKSLLDSDAKKLKDITFKSLLKSGWAKLNVSENRIPDSEGNFGKPGGKCMFYNPEINPPLPEFHPFLYSEEELIQFPLRLLTIKSTKNFLNSSRANHSEHRQKEGKPFLDIHEEDAKKRKIQDGDLLKIYNQRGEIFLTARIKNKVKTGVVCMPQGFWSSTIPGGSSANALTNDFLTDMGGSAALQECRVEVKKA